MTIIVYESDDLSVTVSPFESDFDVSAKITQLINCIYFRTILKHSCCMFFVNYVQHLLLLFSLLLFLLSLSQSRASKSDPYLI